MGSPSVPASPSSITSILAKDEAQARMVSRAGSGVSSMLSASRPPCPPPAAGGGQGGGTLQPGNFLHGVAVAAFLVQLGQAFAEVVGNHCHGHGVVSRANVQRVPLPILQAGNRSCLCTSRVTFSTPGRRPGVESSEPGPSVEMFLESAQTGCYSEDSSEKFPDRAETTPFFRSFKRGNR